MKYTKKSFITKALLLCAIANSCLIHSSMRKHAKRVEAPDDFSAIAFNQNYYSTLYDLRSEVTQYLDKLSDLSTRYKNSYTLAGKASISHEIGQDFQRLHDTLEDQFNIALERCQQKFIALKKQFGIKAGASYSQKAQAIQQIMNNMKRKINDLKKWAEREIKQIEARNT